ncbi:MAG TPA: TonB-dependent receptor [Vicinamibacterales bacterium]|nr:TonB-dependent receptor [Vicinamibacterales bacterium]
MRTIIFRTVLAATVVLSAGSAPAAADPATATLTGTVTAADGARLPGVHLRVLHVDSGSSVEAVSSDAGQFRVGQLAPGRYEVQADLPGFEPKRVENLMLAAGRSVSVTVRLDIASLYETVRVVGEARRDTVEAFEMRESRARDLGEAMAVLPGVSRLRKGAIANDVVMRGFQGKDVTVLIDGQRLDGACPGHMDPPAFHVDFAEVSRVEVSKGPFDVKNQGGLAGVVNVVTERPQRGLHGSANVTAASANTVALSAAASFGRSRWAALAGASTRRADAYKDGAGVRLTDTGGYRQDLIADLPVYDVWTAWGRVALMPRDGTHLQFSYTRQSADAIVYPYLQMDALFDNADRAGARLEIADLPGGWSALAAHAYYTRVDHWMTDELRASSLNKPREYSMGTRAKTAIAGGRTEVQRGPLSIGFEASRRNWNTNTMLAMASYAPQAGLPDVTMDVIGAFGSYAADLPGQWRLETGARVDRAVTEADPLLANTGLYLAYHGTTATRATDVLPAGHARVRWRHDGGWSVMAGIGHSTRVPDQQERFYAFKRMGTDWVGNPALSPSRNTGLDTELRYTAHGVDVGLSAFAYRVDDHIRVIDQRRTMMVPGVMNTMARSFANVDALVRGLEANVTVPLARALFASADVSVVRGTIRGSTALPTDLPEMPPLRARVRLRYDQARWNLVAEALGAARQGNVAVDLREATTPAFAALNLRAGVRFGALNLTAALDNAFDTLYAEHLSYQRDPFRNGVRVYEPGRTFSLNLGARF